MFSIHVPELDTVNKLHIVGKTNPELKKEADALIEQLVSCSIDHFQEVLKPLATAILIRSKLYGNNE